MEPPMATLEQLLVGEFTATGHFEDRWGTVKRRFDVKATGSSDGRVLTFAERFAYDDGEKETRTWWIEKLPDGQYQGSADDVVSPPRAAMDGDKLSWSYRIRLRLYGRGVVLRFDDQFEPTADGLMNTARVSKFGITIGRVRQEFRRIEARPVLAAD